MSDPLRAEKPVLFIVTAKQRIFVKEYLTDFNGTRAAIAAGYSKKSARMTASRMITKANIQAEIAKLTEKRCGKLEITADRVLEELGKLAFFDPRKFFRADGSLVPVLELDDDTAMALAGLEVNELFEGKGDEREMVGYAKKFKLADKGQNLERLGRYFKLFTDKIVPVGADDGPVKLVFFTSKES